MEGDLKNLPDRYLAEKHHGSVWAAIHRSVDALSEQQRERLVELAVFGIQTGGLETAIETLWAHTGGLTQEAARDLLMEFRERALIDFDQPTRRARLHHLVHDFATNVAILRSGSIAELHRRLADAYKSRCPNGWSSGPDDGYYLQNLVAHLLAAGNTGEVVSLLKDIRWIEAKCKSRLVIELQDDYMKALGSVTESTEDNGIAASAGKTRSAVSGIKSPEHSDSNLDNEYLISADDRTTFRVLANSLREHYSFLMKHPATAFQCLWNSCWWHDCPDADAFRSVSPSSGDLSGRVRGPVSALLETWYSEKRTQSSSFFWIRSLRPPPIMLDDELHSKIQIDDPRGEPLALRLIDNQLHAWFCAYVDGRPKPILFGKWNSSTGVQSYLSDAMDAQFPDPSCSLDDTLVASIGSQADGGWGAPVVVRNTQSGETVVTLPVDDEDNLRTVAFSANGERLAAAGYGIESEGEVYVWELRTSRLIAKLQASARIRSLAFSPDGEQIITGSSLGDVQLWGIEQGKLLRTFGGHDDDVLAVTFSSDRTLAASSSSDGTIRIWDTCSFPRQLVRPFHRDSVVESVFSTDGRRLVTRSENGATWLWDGETGKPITCLHDSDFMVLEGGDARTCLFADQERIISLSDEGGVWDAKRGVRLKPPLGLWMVGTGDDIEFSPDGVFITINSRRSFIVRHLGTGRTWQIEGVRCSAFSSNARYLLAITSKNQVQKLNLRDGQQSAHNIRQLDHVECCAVSDDGEFVAAADLAGSIRVWNLATAGEAVSLQREPIRRFDANANEWAGADRGGTWKALRFIGAATLAALTAQNQALVWNYNTNHVLRNIPWAGPLKYFSKDSHFWAVVRGNEFCIGDLESGTELAWFPCPRGFPGYTGLIWNPMANAWVGSLRHQLFHFALEKV